MRGISRLAEELLASDEGRFAVGVRCFQTQCISIFLIPHLDSFNADVIVFEWVEIA